MSDPAIRQLRPDDAGALCALINPIIADGTSTAFRDPFTPERMTAQLIAPPLGISCLVAVDMGGPAGFQTLEWADPDWPGPDTLPPGWALISTFVATSRQGRGIGRALWPGTLEAARQARVTAIDATIRADNAGGLAYYDALGFRDYRRTEWPMSDGTPAQRICKRFDP